MNRLTSILILIIVIVSFHVAVTQAKVRFFSLEKEEEYIEHVAKPVEMALIAKVISVDRGESTSTIGYRPIKLLKGHHPKEDFYLEYDNRNREDNVKIRVPEHTRLRWSDQVFPNYDVGTTVYFTFQDQVRMKKYYREATSGVLVEDEHAFNRIVRIYETANQLELILEKAVPINGTSEFTLICAVVNSSSTTISLISPFHHKMGGRYSWRMIDRNGDVWSGKFNESGGGGFNRNDMVLVELPPGERIEGEISIIQGEMNQDHRTSGLLMNIPEIPNLETTRLYLLYNSYLDGTGTLVSNVIDVE